METPEAFGAVIPAGAAGFWNTKSTKKAGEGLIDLLKTRCVYGHNLFYFDVDVVQLLF